MLQQIGDQQPGTEGQHLHMLADNTATTNLYTYKRTGSAHRIVVLNSRNNTQILYLIFVVLLNRAKTLTHTHCGKHIQGT